MIKFAVMTFMYNNWINNCGGSHEELIRVLAEAGADGIEAFVICLWIMTSCRNHIKKK